MPYTNYQEIDRKQAFKRIRHLLAGAALLAATAGFINAVSLGFFRTPVSHMTGAVSHLGLDIAEMRPLEMATSASIVLGVLLGALLAGLVVGAWQLIPSKRYGVALMLEGLLLGLATGLLVNRTRLALPVVAMACGLQNATASSYCGLMIRTTHVTGTVTDIGVMLGHWIRHRQIDTWKLRFLVTLFLAFGAGGWAGALANLQFGPRVLGVAAAGCTVAGAVFWFVTHRGIVDLMQSEMPRAPRTSSFPTDH